MTPVIIYIRFLLKKLSNCDLINGKCYRRLLYEAESFCGDFLKRPIKADQRVEVGSDFKGEKP